MEALFRAETIQIAVFCIAEDHNACIVKKVEKTRKFQTRSCYITWIELDVFGAPYDGRILAEVEFPDEKAAADYKPADWFLEDVTGDVRYSNAHMSTEKLWVFHYFQINMEN